MFIKIKPQNKLTALFFALLCAGGLGLFGISLNPAVPFPFVAQGLGVLLLVFGVVLCTKFILRTLYYSIQPAGIFDADGNEIYDLEVIEEIGKKRTTVCRVNLRDVVRVQSRPARATKKNGQSEIRANGGTVFRYCADLFPEQIMVIDTADGDVVVLTFQAQIFDILSQK